jgi:hypothetical protein
LEGNLERSKMIGQWLHAAVVVCSGGLFSMLYMMLFEGYALG